MESPARGAAAVKHAPLQASLLILAVTTGCRQHPWSDPSPHQSLYAQVNGVRLNYLDWGGDGPPLVMLHGLGDSPHLFDDLAGCLRPNFRLIAYARRGHGHSDAPAAGPYDLATLVEDLRQLLDYLRIPRASLLGWSVGGNEISQFAALYPDRVERLVYLEGGYEWSDPAFLNAFAGILEVNSPRASDLRSLDAFRAWFREAWLGKETQWTPGLEAYLRDTTRIGFGGRVELVPRDHIADLLFASLASSLRDYSRIQAPILALHAAGFFPARPRSPAINRKIQAFEDFMAAFRRYNMDRICREGHTVTVKWIADRTHLSIGVRHPEALAPEIRAFLLAGGTSSP
jgi:pimeloyl-ACP methyl ester carboxylesterase